MPPSLPLPKLYFARDVFLEINFGSFSEAFSLGPGKVSDL